MRNGKQITSVVFSVIVEEESRKIRNMAVKREKHVNGQGQLEKETLTIYCSCDVEWKEDGLIDS